MKLMYLLWGYAYDDGIIRAFEAEGFQVERISFIHNDCLDNSLGKEWDVLKSKSAEEAKKLVETKLSNCSADVIFSVNFNAEVSEFCQQKKIPYCSWVLQLPNFDLYTKSVFNSCNYIGICDSYLVEKMWQLGVEKTYFLPDAIELGKKVDNVQIEREFCFVAKHPISILNTEKMTLYGKGYLDSFLHAQRVLFGANILEDGLINRVYQEFIDNNSIQEQILPQMQKLFIADKYLAPTCTEIQQNIFMKNNENIMTIYSDGSFEMSNAKKYPYVIGEKERRRIYAGKEFTLILAPHVLHHGIPRDTLEVIAAGGFPLCGYQKDYGYFFEQDVNLAYFTNMAEFTQMIVKYGNNHEERERVRENAYQAVAVSHTYCNRIITMLEAWERLSK